MSNTATAPQTSKRFLSFTLSLYLAKRFLGSIFATTLALVMVILLADGVELARRLAERNASGEEVLLMTFLKMPDMLLQLTPFAIMLGTMLCFTSLAKSHELTTIRASGISAWQFLIPPAFICICIGTFNILALNPISSATLKMYERKSADYFPNQTKGLVVEGGSIWLKQIEPDAEIIIHAKRLENLGLDLYDASLFHFSKGVYIERLTAESMHLDSEKSAWRILNGTLLRPNMKSEYIDELELPTTITKEKLKDSFNSPNSLSVWAMPDFINSLKEAGFPSLEYEMQFHRILAYPALALAMFILAVPFSLRMLRQGGIGKLLLTGLLLGFAFYLFTNIIAGYGLQGQIPLALAAWSPACIAALVGLALLLHFREE